MTRVLFRADASEAMGVGHAMRCRALAEAVIERGGQALFVMNSPPDGIRTALAGTGIDLTEMDAFPASTDDARRLLALAEQEKAHALVLDGYHFDSAYMRMLADTLPLMVLDDMASLDALPCHALVNPSPSAFNLPYGRIAPHARLLLGPQYALIRADIRALAGTSRPPPSARKSLVLTFGGSDPLALTLPVAQALLAELPTDARLEVVIGPADPRADQIVTTLAPQLGHDHIHVASPSVATLFAGAGLAVTAGGGTVGELAALGVPAVVAVVADNQEGAAGSCPYPCIDARHDHAPAALATEALRWWHDPAARDRLATGLRGLVDGQGAARTAEVIFDLRR